MTQCVGGRKGHGTARGNACGPTKHPAEETAGDPAERFADDTFHDLRGGTESEHGGKVFDLIGVRLLAGLHTDVTDETQLQRQDGNVGETVGQ